MTLTDIQNTINGLIHEFSGKRIAFPNGSYYGECTAPIVHYFTRLGIPVPPMAYDSAEGWGRSFPYQLAPYFTHEPFQPGKAYPYGSIPMWNSPHIAIILSSDGSNTMRVFQQNADPNGAPCQISNRVVSNSTRQCTYVLVPRIETPAPPAPPPAAQTYRPQTKSIDPYKARTKLPVTWLYALNYDNMDALAANHVGQQPQGYEFTVTGEAYNQAVNKTFLLPEGWNGDSPVGFLKDECEPIPVAPVYVPPAAPIQFPHNDEYYTVYDTLVAYKSSNDALNDLNGQGIVKPGIKYYVYNRRIAADNPKNVAVNVTLIKGQPGSWINELKNQPIKREPVPVVSNVAPPVVANVPVPAPTPITDIAPVVAPVEKPQATITVTVQSDTPEQIRASYQPFLTNNMPISARVKADVMVTELLHQGKPFLVKAGWPLHLYGVVHKNDQLYAVCRPKNQPLPPKGPDLYAIAINSRSDFSPSLREVSGLIENMRLEYENIHYSVSKSKLARTIDGVIKELSVKK